MLILIIGLVTFTLWSNLFWYEYRVFKVNKEDDIIKKYVQLQFNRKYK